MISPCYRINRLRDELTSMMAEYSDETINHHLKTVSMLLGKLEKWLGQTIPSTPELKCAVEYCNVLGTALVGMRKLDEDILRHSLIAWVGPLTEVVDAAKLVMPFGPRDPNSTRSRLDRIISTQLGISCPENYGSEASWIDDLGIDSLDAIEIVMVIEEEFEIEIAETEADDIRTIGDMVTLIDSKLEKTRVND